jgi:hypothetical protein
MSPEELKMLAMDFARAYSIDANNKVFEKLSNTEQKMEVSVSTMVIEGLRKKMGISYREIRETVDEVLRSHGLSSCASEADSNRWS